MKIDLKIKAEEIRQEFESWAKQNGVLSVGHIINVTIEIIKESPVRVKLEKTQRSNRKGRFYRTTEKVCEDDLKKLSRFSHIFNGQQADLLSQLVRSKNRPVDAKCLTSVRVMNDMNSRLIGADLNFRVVSHPYGATWRCARLMFVHVKPRLQSHKQR